jgi:hypothetical protein
MREKAARFWWSLLAAAALAVAAPFCGGFMERGWMMETSAIVMP